MLGAFNNFIYDGCMPNGEPKEGESLADLFPDIASQWHPTLNGDLMPEDIVGGVKKKYWWKCGVGPDHEWKTSLESRYRGSGCPCCANQRVSVTNSFGVLFPKISLEWHGQKNGDLNPSDVVASSSKRVWWKCKEGPDHEWQQAVRRRTGLGADALGCPFCVNQKVSVTNQLAILAPDLAKEWHPTKNGSLTAETVVATSQKRVWWLCNKESDHVWRIAVSNRFNGSKCPYCAGRKVALSNCLATLLPELADEWHPTKNGKLTPFDVCGGSSRKVWWQCKVNAEHVWRTDPIHRTSRGSGCPKCGNKKSAEAKKVPKDGQSLLDLYPGVALIWDFQANGDLTPSMVKSSAHQKVHWACKEAEDHRWEAPVLRITASSKTGNSGCPFCAGKRASSTNNLVNDFPSLADEWDYESNGDLIPKNMPTGSGKKVSWICPVAEEHRWLATVASRTRGNGCPFCGHILPSSTSNFRDHGPQHALMQWDYEKNQDKQPENFLPGSNTKVWWKCDVAEDHTWEALINTRSAEDGNSPALGCPFCRGLRPSSTNNLLDHAAPHIAEEWDYENNAGLRPEDFTVSSGKKVSWKCSAFPEHHWRATIDIRTGVNKRGCPLCTLTPRSAPEMRLAHELFALIDFDLESHKLTLGGRRRDVDIIIEPMNIVIEYDGSYWHRNKQAADIEKTQLMEKEGWEVIRVRERPLDSIHANDVLVEVNPDAKGTADQVFQKIVEITGVDIRRLKEYLASDQPWREKEALSAIREYQAENARKKAELAARRAAKKKP